MVYFTCPNCGEEEECDLWDQEGECEHCGAALELEWDESYDAETGDETIIGPIVTLKDGDK